MRMTYTERQVAEKLNIPVGTLRNHRCIGRGLPYVKIGGCVRYRQEDVEAYLGTSFQPPEGYVRPAIHEPCSEPTLTDDKPKLTDWKAQVLDAMLSNGIIPKRFTGKITLEIESGCMKAALKQEEL